MGTSIGVGSHHPGSIRDTGWVGDTAHGSCDEARETRRESAIEACVPVQTAVLRIGASLARYVVLEEIGRGGMGQVLRAYDPKLQREVALKVVRHDALDDHSTARLVAEARAMAKLSHPHVVCVYDVEALDAGEVVLVMEYLDGQTLRDWLHKRDDARNWQSIVSHFLNAGQGLAAAHDAGILHRDFKPTNVLISPAGVVKVTDFGVAKLSTSASTGASNHSITSGDGLTIDGAIVGTPRYMAPEQRQGLPLTAAADQYAFCVSLWEALCGSPPFSGAADPELGVAGPPRWPRSTAPRPIVEAITRGLAPAPRDRWRSMHELLHALARGPERRRKRWLLASGALSVLVAGGVGHQAWAQARGRPCNGAADKLTGVWDETRREQVSAAFAAVMRSYAAAAETRAVSALDTYASQWAAMHTDACEATTVRVEQSPALMDLRMGCLHRAAMSLEAVVDVLAHADAAVVQRADEVVREIPPLARCADVDALAAEIEPPRSEEADAVATTRMHLARAKSLRGAGRYDAAMQEVESAKDALVGVEYGPVQSEVALDRAETLVELGDYDAAQIEAEGAMRVAARWRQSEITAQAGHVWMHTVGVAQGRVEQALQLRPVVEGLAVSYPSIRAGVHHVVAVLVARQGKPTEAEAEHRAGLALREKLLEPTDPQLAHSHGALGAALIEQGRYAEAEREIRSALALVIAMLGPEHPKTASIRGNLGAVLIHAQKYTEAVEELRATVATTVTALSPSHPDVARYRENLSIAHRFRGESAEAEIELRAAVEVAEAALGSSHTYVARLRGSLASVLADQDKHDEAEPLFRAVLAAEEAALGPDHPTLLDNLTAIALMHQMQGRNAEAEVELRAALSRFERLLPSDDVRLAFARRQLGDLLAAQGRYAEAEPIMRFALAKLEATIGPDDNAVARARASLADVLRNVGRASEALPLAELAWARHQRDNFSRGEAPVTAFILARILWDIEPPARDRIRARSLAEGARVSHENDRRPDKEQMDEVQRWLDTHRLD